MIPKVAWNGNDHNTQLHRCSTGFKIIGSRDMISTLRASLAVSADSDSMYCLEHSHSQTVSVKLLVENCLLYVSSCQVFEQAQQHALWLLILNNKLLFE